jgi:hypothetical protein
MAVSVGEIAADPDGRVRVTRPNRYFGPPPKDFVRVARLPNADHRENPVARGSQPTFGVIDRPNQMTPGDGSGADGAIGATTIAGSGSASVVASLGQTRR